MDSNEWVIIDCPGCAVKLKVSPPSAGEVMRCPECNHLFEVPRVEEAKEALAVKVSVASRAEEPIAEAEGNLESQPANEPPSETKGKDLLIQDYAAVTSEMELGELEPEQSTPILFSNPDAHRLDREGEAKRVEIKPSTARTPSLSGKYFEHIIAPSTATNAPSSTSDVDAFEDFKARMKTAEVANREHEERGERRKVWKYRPSEGPDDGDSIGDYGNEKAATEAAVSTATATPRSKATAAPKEPPARRASQPARSSQASGGSSPGKTIRFSRTDPSSRSHWQRFGKAWILVGLIALVSLIFLIKNKIDNASRIAVINSNSRSEAYSEARERFKTPDSGLPDDMGSPEVFIESVRDVVEGFMAAETMEERLKYVRNPVATRTRMLGFYKRNPELDQAKNLKSIREVVGSNGDLRILTLELEGEESRVLWLAKHEDGGYLVDWDSWVEYSDMEWDQFVEEKPLEGQSFMVKLILSEDNIYYAYDFNDPENQRCWIVEIPRMGKTAFAYTPKKGSEVDKALFEEMEKQYARNYTLTIFARVKLAYPENAKTDNQLLITDYLGLNWVEDDSGVEEDPSPATDGTGD